MTWRADRPGSIAHRAKRNAAAGRRSARLCALLALFAHLLVTVHVAAHVAASTADGARSHCIVCIVGKHASGVPATTPIIWKPLDVPAAGFVRVQTVPPQPVDEAALARAPPSPLPVNLDTAA